jgi:hypothetical protein
MAIQTKGTNEGAIKAAKAVAAQSAADKAAEGQAEADASTVSATDADKELTAVQKQFLAEKVQRRKEADQRAAKRPPSVKPDMVSRAEKKKA